MSDAEGIDDQRCRITYYKLRIVFDSIFFSIDEHQFCSRVNAYNLQHTALNSAIRLLLRIPLINIEHLCERFFCLVE